MELSLSSAGFLLDERGCPVVFRISILTRLQPLTLPNPLNPFVVYGFFCPKCRFYSSI